MTALCPDGHSAYGCKWQHGGQRVPQSTPLPGRNRSAGCQQFWYGWVPSQWQERVTLFQHAPSYSLAARSAAVALCSWVVGSKTIADDICLHLLDEGGSLNVKGSRVLATFRMSEKFSAFDPPPQTLFSVGLWTQGALPPTTDNWFGTSDTVPARD